MSAPEPPLELAPARLRAPGGREDLAPEALRWRARELDPAALGALRRFAFARGRVLERDDASILAIGTAARLELPAGLAEPGAGRTALELLRAIPPDPAQPPGAAALAVGPLALGALAFQRDAPGALSLAALTVVARPGNPPVAIELGEPGELDERRGRFPFDPGARPSEQLDHGAPPDSFELASVRPHEDFTARVEAALEAIEQGLIEKVVLVREVAVRANRPLRQHDLLERLRALHPSCATFALDGFVGASPELLCRRRGARVDAQPLAGTVARSGDPEQDGRLAAALLASAKERAEHRVVVDAILAGLAPYCSALAAPATPHLLELRNVAHLATRIEGTLLAGGEVNALELVAALHPTPAVGGAPRDAALEYLAKFEELERDRFAGPVGWLRADGDGEWWIGIRSALVTGSTARLLAGVGIVAGSNPAAELAETQLKLQALLAAAVRP